MRPTSTLLLFLIAILLSACAAPAPAVPAVTATATSLPATSTAALRPTRTPLPTRTPFPTVPAGALVPGQHGYSFQASSGEQVSYLLYVPESFDPGRKWPLIVFLHGSNQMGVPPEMLKAEYLPKMLETKTDLPFLVLSPVLPTGQWADYLDPVDELVTHLVATLPVDGDRLYLTGLSKGAFGTWAYALKYPDRFAAIAPIAGAYSHGADLPPDLCKLKGLPVWVFHGAADTSVPPAQAQAVVDGLRACGGDVKFTLYPDTNHPGTWFNAYEDPALFDWFLQHSK